MPDSKSTDEQRSINYLVQVLQRNPLEESASIIRGRNRLLGLTKSVTSQSQPGVDLGKTRQQRERALQQVEQLRKIVWTAPLEQLRGELDAVSANRFPDIQATVKRLSTLVAQRSQFPSLVEHPHFDADFFSTLKEVLASPPREVAILKERQIVAFGKRKKRRRGKKMLRLLKKEQPALYALEAAWLDSLTRQRNPVIMVSSRSTPNKAAQSTLQDENDGLEKSGGINIPWWAIIFGLLILSKILRALGAFDD